MTRKKKRNKNSGCGCLGLPLVLFAFCLADQDDVPANWRRAVKIVRWTVFLLPSLFILRLCGVPVPNEILPFSFICSLPLLLFLGARLRDFLEKFPTQKAQADTETEEKTKKMPISILLVLYALILLILVLMVNIPLFLSGNLCGEAIFFMAFGTILCFVFTGIIREMRIRYYFAFAAMLYTGVTGLLLIGARYAVFPFFWTLFVLCMGGLFAVDKRHIFRLAGGAKMTTGTKRLFLIVIGIFSLIGILASLGQIKTNWKLYTIRHAPPSEIREIVLTQKESAREIVLSQPKIIAKFQKGLAESYLFQKKKRSSDSDYAPWWQVKLVWRDGRSHQFSLGNGTGHHQDAVFIRFTKDNDYFQSRALYKTLQPLLWPGMGAEAKP